MPTAVLADYIDAHRDRFGVEPICEVLACAGTNMAHRQPLPPDMFDEPRPSSLLPFRFGDKWAALVIHCLEYGPRRFSELRVPLRRVTPKALTQSLRGLERDGLVSRTVHADPKLRGSTR